MTHYEKAIELVNKFNNVFYLTYGEAIQCALICVDEILDVLKSVFGQDGDKQSDIVYFQQVKQELLKL